MAALEDRRPAGLPEPARRARIAGPGDCSRRSWHRGQARHATGAPLPHALPTIWELALLLAAVVTLLGVVVGTIRTGAPPMPTRPGVRAVMISLLPANPTVIHELGAGFGGVAFAAAAARPSAMVHAWEKAWLPWFMLRMRAGLFGQGRVLVHRGDLLDAPHEQACVVLVYLHPAAMADLAPRLASSLAPGAVVISNAFALPGWTPFRELRLDDALRTTVRAYEVPSGFDAADPATPADHPGSG